ncbi:EI24 domain-containing protein [Nocardioides pantholopis]|uniref:EI24 domain-containing protein n=1 Tax=Nocardioides pantholopis TaxID=2483798 RepID=UPI000FD86176|nr:EI24 domain-containing protein [Nocardioides pantholopis]
MSGTGRQRPALGAAPVLSGPAYLLRGFGMWRRRPGLMVLGMVPALLVLAVLVAVFVVLVLQVGDLVGWATPFLDDTGEVARSAVRVSLAVVVVVGFVVLAAATFVALTLLVGEPFYDRIWRETERMLGGEVPDADVGLLRGIRDGAVLLGLGAATAVGMVVLGLLPVVGTIAAGVAGFGFSAWLLAGELLTRPLEARGLTAADRSELVRGRRGPVLGLGMSVQACFLVPLGAVVVMPAAVVGATMLARDLLDASAARRT